MEKNLQIINKIDYDTMVKTIRETEQTRNWDEAILAFQHIWDDIEIDPDFSEFPLQQRAELFRLSGYFLNYYGKANNRRNFQERAKNLLTNSIEIYYELNQLKNVADAQNILALCYFYEGAILEAEAILEQTAADFLPDKLDLVYLQNRGNILITKIIRNKYDEALEIIEELLIPMEFCENKKACCVFNEKAGMTFRGIKQYNRATYHFKRAIQYAEEMNNGFLISTENNNLANLYRIMGKFELAHFHEDIAINIAKTNKLIGWLPHCLDTKASIFFEEGNFQSALEYIDEAISIFQKGEDANGLTESLWNKCKFLLYLDRKQEAIKLFSELAPIAAERMGEFALENFSNEFAELIHVKKGGSLTEETMRFRRMEVITAIRKAKYNLQTASKLLKIELVDLTKVLDNEFPELFEEINLERFALLNNEEKDRVQPTRRNISELILPNLISNLDGQFSTFYIAAELNSGMFGVSLDMVMAIEPIDKLIPNELTLFYSKETATYSFVRVQYDKMFELFYYLEKDEPVTISLDEVILIGKALRYIPFTEIDNEKLEFRPLEF